MSESAVSICNLAGDVGTTLAEVLDKDYVFKCLRVTWDRLRRTWRGKGCYLKSKDIMGRAKEESDINE